MMTPFRKKIVFFISLIFFASLIFSFWFYFFISFQKEKIRKKEGESLLGIFRKSFSEISSSFKEVFFQAKTGIKKEIEKEKERENILRNLSNQVLKKLENKEYEKKEK